MKRKRWRSTRYAYNCAFSSFYGCKSLLAWSSVQLLSAVPQAKAEKEFQGEPEQPIDSEEAERASKEADSRSVYVGNVDYDCTPEELQRHFQVLTLKAKQQTEHCYSS